MPNHADTIPLSLDAQTWRGIARAAMDVLHDQYIQIEQQRQTITALREELRERMGVAVNES